MKFYLLSSISPTLAESCLFWRNISLADGIFTLLAKPNHCLRNLNLVDGNFTLVDGNFTLVDGNFTLVDGNFTLVDGNFTLVDSNFTLVDGNFTLVDGNFTLVDGILPGPTCTYNEHICLLRERLYRFVTVGIDVEIDL